MKKRSKESNDDSVIARQFLTMPRKAMVFGDFCQIV